MIKDSSTQGSRFSLFLDMKGIKQRQAADLFGVTQSTVSAWRRRLVFSPKWYEEHIENLKKIGCNPTFLADPLQPMEWLEAGTLETAVAMLDSAMKSITTAKLIIENLEQNTNHEHNGKARKGKAKNAVN
jgi:transcriptional regulator with XRE-family HTH domain